MSADSSQAVDVWRQVSARRVLEGEWPLASFPRLTGLLASDEGTVRYRIEFGRDALEVPFARVDVDAGLPLTCQRSLQVFVQPVQVEQMLGLIRDEGEEAGLPPGYEPLLVPEDGRIVPQSLVEDELILAVPVVPIAPGSEAVERDWPVTAEEAEEANPFAALSALKRDKHN